VKATIGAPMLDISSMEVISWARGRSGVATADGEEMMAGDEVLVVAELQRVHDAEGLKRYQQGARAQISRFGGVVLGRGGNSFEGSPAFGTVLVQKWPSAEAFAAWQNSEDYRPLREIRQRCADMRIAIVPLLA
jgi:uncharacterized protein (DUF1330 family)